MIQLLDSEKENIVEKGGSAMKTAIILQKSEKDYLEKMDKYIQSMQAQPKEIASARARCALVRTGVITKNGKRKKK